MPAACDHSPDLNVLTLDSAVGNALCGTAPIGFATWLFVVPFAVVMLVFEELRKAVVRRRDRDEQKAVKPNES